MSNLFSSINYPQTEPSELIIGDRWAWKRTDLGNDYAPASYSLSYTARLESSGSTTFSITCSESGNDYIVEVASATTAAYTVGVYHWQMYITRTSDSERIMLDSGTFELVANRASSTADPRTHAKIVLDAIEAVIEGRATKDQESYSIEGRSLSRTSISDLLLFRDRYKAEVRKEEIKEAIKNGKSGAKVVYKL